MRSHIILRKTNAGAQRAGARGDADTGSNSALAFERLTDREAASIAIEPDVEAVAPAMSTRLIEPKASTSSELPKVWGLEAVGANGSTFTGDGVTVAVLDTGIDDRHPAFQGVALEQHDFTGDGIGDRQGHGTHCAGTIFGRSVDGVRIGVAPGVKRALIGKVLGDGGAGDTRMLVEAIQWAVSRRANIVSMSLGFDFPRMVEERVDEGWPIDRATSYALEAYRSNLRVLDAVMALTRAQGMLDGSALVIAASGNESLRDRRADWRIAASLPAAAQEVLSVAAVGQDGERLRVADFSNSMAVVSGPGVEVVSARAGGGLVSMSGTSMACPHVAGLAALWWEALRRRGRTPTAKNVNAALIASARKDVFGEAGAEVDVGQGLAVAPTN